MQLPKKLDLQEKTELPPPETEAEPVVSSSKKLFSKIKLPHLPKPVKIGLLTLLGLFLFFVLVSGVFALSVRKQTKSASSSISQITTSLQEKDLVSINAHLETLESNINKIQSSYKRFCKNSINRAVKTYFSCSQDCSVNILFRENKAEASPSPG